VVADIRFPMACRLNLKIDQRYTKENDKLFCQYVKMERLAKKIFIETVNSTNK
jgi:hypothetical protein